MKILIYVFVLSALLIGQNCNNDDKSKGNDTKKDKKKPMTEKKIEITKVKLTTDSGEIIIELYKDTPLHRENFIKLVKEGFYDSTQFHRIIKDFMVQGGGAKDGSEDIGYTVPAEFMPNHIHKRGALCAARMPDNVNPKKESSGSQFYIVQGRVFDQNQLVNLYVKMQKNFTDEQIQAYTTVGGAPHLDGDYTVYGEVVSGMDIVDKLASVTVNPAFNHKPVKPLYLIKAEIITE